MGCRGTWFTYLGRMAPPAGLRFICLHKMADKLFTCKYKLRAWETWHAFLELPAVPILCASHSKKQPGLSLEFSAKGTVLTSQVHFNPKFLSATSRIHGTILGDCMSSKKESINISERVINSHVSNFYLFQEKEVGVPLSETTRTEAETRETSAYSVSFICLLSISDEVIGGKWFYLFPKDIIPKGK